MAEAIRGTDASVPEGLELATLALPPSGALR